MGQGTKSRNFKKTVYSHLSNYSFIFQVVVDDFIPVGFDDKPIFISSKDVGEVWPCLLEKAYAKLHGNTPIPISLYKLNVIDTFFKEDTLM